MNLVTWPAPGPTGPNGAGLNTREQLHDVHCFALRRNALLRFWEKILCKRLYAWSKMGASTKEAKALGPHPYAHETLLGHNRNPL